MAFTLVLRAVIRPTKHAPTRTSQQANKETHALATMRSPSLLYNNSPEPYASTPKGKKNSVDFAFDFDEKKKSPSKPVLPPIHDSINRGYVCAPHTSSVNANPQHGVWPQFGVCVCIVWAYSSWCWCSDVQCLKCVMSHARMPNLRFPLTNESNLCHALANRREYVPQSHAHHGHPSSRDNETRVSSKISFQLARSSMIVNGSRDDHFQIVADTPPTLGGGAKHSLPSQPALPALKFGKMERPQTSINPELIKSMTQGFERALNLVETDDDVGAAINAMNTAIAERDRPASSDSSDSSDSEDSEDSDWDLDSDSDEEQNRQSVCMMATALDVRCNVWTECASYGVHSLRRCHFHTLTSRHSQVDTHK